MSSNFFYQVTRYFLLVFFCLANTKKNSTLSIQQCYKAQCYFSFSTMLHVLIAFELLQWTN